MGGRGPSGGSGRQGQEPQPDIYVNEKKFMNGSSQVHWG